MVLNKKAQAGYAIAFMLAISLIIMGLAFAKPINQITTDAMNETNGIGEVGGMNCTGTTDDFVKAGCITADIGQSYFIGGLIALAGVLIAARIIFA